MQNGQEIENKKIVSSERRKFRWAPWISSLAVLAVFAALQFLVSWNVGKLAYRCGFPFWVAEVDIFGPITWNSLGLVINGGIAIFASGTVWYLTNRICGARKTKNQKWRMIPHESDGT